MDQGPVGGDRTAEGGERAGRPTSLSAAIRAARVEVADRAQALGDLRDAELARLELLRELMEPVLAEMPPEVDLFDVGLVPGEHPRLFVDMVAFVEMARDRRTYRLVQDRRHARAVLFEGEGAHAALSAVTAYIARRLVEREQLLSSLGRAPAPAPRAAPPPPAAARPGGGRGLLRAVRIVVDGFGLATLGGLAWLGLQAGLGRLSPW
jgi:hypothetical protein